MSLLPFNSKELHFIIQGLKALEDETNNQKQSLLKRNFPDDHNTDTILEYLDKRGVELKELEKKVFGLVGT